MKEGSARAAPDVAAFSKRGVSHLRRLEALRYRGAAFVHWSMTIEGRMTGWLTVALHTRLRELLLHACAVYDVAIPAYCLMPDHVHLLCAGMRPGADQLRAIRFFRRHSGSLLSPHSWQRQAYDHALRDEELSHGGVEALGSYILLNPVRAGIVEDASLYPHSGCIVPGRPSASVFEEGYWADFWKHYADYGPGRVW